MNTPLVSIVVPTFNQARYLPTCLDWVLHQDYPHLEIIVVDGGSSDDTKAILASLERDVAEQQVSRVVSYHVAPDGTEELVRETSPRYPAGRDLKIFTFDEDIGATETYNEGFRRISGEYATYVVGDDIPGIQMVSTLVRSLEETGADFAYADATLVDDAGRIVQILRPPEYDFETCFADWYRLGVARLYRASWHQTVGLFDTAYRSANDYDMYLRFAMAGCRFIHVPEVIYSVRHHGPDRRTGQHTAEREARLFEESKACARRARAWLADQRG